MISEERHLAAQLHLFFFLTENDGVEVAEERPAENRKDECLRETHFGWEALCVSEELNKKAVVVVDVNDLPADADGLLVPAVFDFRYSYFGGDAGRENAPVGS